MNQVIENGNSQSKKTAFNVAKFQHHLQNTIPNLFGKSENLKIGKESIIRTKKNDRNMVFHYAKHTSDGISIIDAETIFHSIKKLYIRKDCMKINENSFQKVKTYKLSYLPVYGVFHEIIQFHIIDKNQTTYQQKNYKSTNSSFNRRSSTHRERSMSTTSSEKLLPNNFELFVIHHCKNNMKSGQNSMRWENFTERYQFIDEIHKDETKPKINYQLIFNYQENQSILNYFNQQSKLYELFLADYLIENQNGLQNIDKLQGYLLQSTDKVQKKIKKINDPAFNQDHKRWLKLPMEYYKLFTVLKKKAMSYYQTIHSKNNHTEIFLNNLICRYMQAKQYNQTESLESILEYLRWENSMSKFNLTMFTKYHELDFFMYLGQDFQGRAVILNKAAHVKVDDITDIQEYCNYCIYFLQIWSQKQLKGYADQYTVIADFQGLAIQNFKLSITKRNMNDSLTYSPERQSKLLVVNASTFANFVWSITKPLLPKKTVAKFNMVGSNKDDILEALSKQMDISVIPQYLGGTNKRTYKNDLEQELASSFEPSILTQL